MNALCRFALASQLAVISACCIAGNSETAEECNTPALDEHVLAQLAIYGPRSSDREFFGFAYRVDRAIDSVVVSSNRCRGPDGCKVDTRLAAKRIPKRAKVLGEWHTHPHLNGSRSLSAEDVNGAHQNIHIRCYAAYYAGPTGRVYRWDPHSTSVPTAMASRENLGSYRLDGRDTDRPYLATTSPDD